jgi:transcriptional regulator with XRE-family HTH domain
MNEIKNFDERTRIGSRLAEVRKAHRWVDANGIKRVGITQTELSQISGIKQANIARIECGKYNSTFDTLTALAGAMGKKIDIV